MSASLSPLGAQMRAADPDRFYAALFAPAEKRDALFALLAFNHEVARVREIVTEPVIGQIRLTWWQEALSEIEERKSPRAHPVVAALQAAHGSHAYDIRLLHDLIEARVFDLYDDPMPDQAALMAYAHATGGGLHRAMAQVCGAQEHGQAAAESVGAAWALTGLVRALRIHSVRGQLYLPRADLEAARVSSDEVFSGAATERLRPVLDGVIGLARMELGRAKRIALGQALPAALCGALLPLYWRRIESRRFDPFRSPSEPVQAAKMFALLAAALRGEI